MEIVMHNDCTIIGTRRGANIHFYGSDALTVINHSPQWVKVQEERGYLGFSAIIRFEDLDLLAPRLVKLGYKMAITNC